MQKYLWLFHSTKIIIVNKAGETDDFIPPSSLLIKTSSNALDEHMVRWPATDPTVTERGKAATGGLSFLLSLPLC